MRVRKKIYSGCVLEQEIYCVPDGTRVFRNLDQKLRFKTDEDRIAHREKIALKKYIRKFNATFSPESLYSTLTFDMANEVHSFAEAKAVRNNFVRILKYKYPDAKITIVIGTGKNTHRYHMHMVSDGIPSEYIKNKWIFGNVERIENLRKTSKYNGEEYAPDYTALATYLFNHWRPEFGGHHYYATRNVRVPESERPTECKRLYTPLKPPKAPKGYALVEVEATSYGYLNFKYILLCEKNRC